MSVNDLGTGLQYAGALGASGLFPTWRNLARPAYLRMLVEIPRFHHAARKVIANSTVSPKPNELADGIATALVTTLVGLWLAIPAIAAFNILRNRFARLVLEVGIVSENLMSRFQNVGSQKSP